MNVGGKNTILVYDTLSNGAKAPEWGKAFNRQINLTVIENSDI